MMEKRKHQRFSQSFPVRVVKTCRKEGIMFEESKNQALNISKGGILIKAAKSLDIGETVNVMFLKPNSFEILNTEGEIRRSDKATNNDSYDIGIFFPKLSDDQREDLVRAIK
jgi:c-di-GMP-binding flagellar brake protein YcgR